MIFKENNSKTQVVKDSARGQHISSRTRAGETKELTKALTKVTRGRASVPAFGTSSPVELSIRGRTTREITPRTSMKAISPNISTPIISTPNISKAVKAVKASKDVLPKLKDSYAILDLDHTLINTETTSQPNPILEEHCDFHFKLQGHHYYVFKRPGVDQFLDTLIKNFKGIAVWTAAMATYAKQIIKGLFGIKRAPSLILIWTRCQTQNDQDGLYKALTRIWNDPVYGHMMNANNTVHIDNTDSVMRYNPDQALLVPDFYYYKVDKSGNDKITFGRTPGSSSSSKRLLNILPAASNLGPNLRVTFNTTDNYLIYLDNLIKDLVAKKQDTLKNFIVRGNLLTQWYMKIHPLTI